jgi:WD40 repeat protein
VFAVVVAVCAIGLAAYLYRINGRTSAARTAASHPPLPRGTLSGPLTAPQILFRYVGVDDDYGKLAAVAAADPRAPRVLEGLSCDVVHFAAGRGICLSANRGVLTTYAATIFDSRQTPLSTTALRGEPSRCRMSPDGRLAAFTVFVSGHSYSSLDFSTETMILDADSGKTIANVESFAVTRNGAPFSAKDFNFWGVSFTPDSQHFYCTLATNRTQYLVAGDIASRTATVIHDNVECPSVSPDGSRVAYKKRLDVDHRVVWQLHVLNLADQRETPLRETRSVDDQLEWLDADHVLYAVSDNPSGSSASTAVWVADASGLTPPQILIPKAYSPAVVRPAASPRRD